MSNNLRDSAQRVQDALHSHGINAKVIEFKEFTRTSEEAANTIGCTVGQIAKTLIFKGKNTGKDVCVIASGINRVDKKKIAAHIGEPIMRADADYVLKCTGFAIGGIPPLGISIRISFLNR